ncbi:hypothetical protein QWY31_06880 [Cytophagales bacterium LB-30]|uniref:Uncharacterized protein n=1 Tax=Shiella aurantiaca TaxID=3058365 RepID=A0ABT8F4A0_9BACT|nr:hypothetical protein [Shiella aurantiaca]MDN4165218.1 hypothetical protein [Shiella aurantiaca]
MNDQILIDGNKYLFDLNLQQIVENGKVVLYSPTLDLAGIGNTEAQASDDLKAIIEITFEYAIQKGTLEKLLFSQGWQKLEGKIQSRPLELSAANYHKSIAISA